MLLQIATAAFILSALIDWRGGALFSLAALGWLIFR